jgi:ketosteroid isomerase-like protein
MKAAVIAHWTGSVPGREREALQLKRDIDEFYGKLLDEGRIDDVSWFLGTDGPNYWIMRGDDETLREIEMMPENLLLTSRAGFLNTDFGYGVFATGDAADAIFGLFEQTAKELHYA